MISSVAKKRPDAKINGELLKRHRDTREMTQEQFAQLIGQKRNWISGVETAGSAGAMVYKHKVAEVAKSLGVSLDSLLVGSGERFEMITMTRRPFFDVRIPAGQWVDTEPREEPDGFEIVPPTVPADAFCLRIFGDCMEPTFPSGSVIVFVPVRPGEGGAEQFQNGKPHYFEHSDGKATFKRVFFNDEQEHYELKPINPKCKDLKPIPAQMMARMSRAVKIIANRDVE